MTDRALEQCLKDGEFRAHLTCDMATSGRLGFSSANSSAVSSPTSNGPAQQRARSAQRHRRALGRCAVPTASMTKMSHSEATPRQAFAVLLLTLLNRPFSHSTTCPARLHAFEPVLMIRHAAQQRGERVATGCSDNAGSICPLPGDPDATSGSHARPFKRHRDRGSAAAIRASLVTSPPGSYVQILPDQNPLPRKSIALIWRTFIARLYLAFDQAIAVSSMRFEKPHRCRTTADLHQRASMIFVRLAS